MGFQRKNHPCAARVCAGCWGLCCPSFINRKLKSTWIKWIFWWMQQVHGRAGNWTPTSFSPIFISPISKLRPSVLRPAVSCWNEKAHFLSQFHLARALPWSPSDEVRSEFSLFKDSVQLPDRKIRWAESQSDVGKEGEKASRCHRRCIPCGFATLCKNRWIYSVSGVNTRQCTLRAGRWTQLGNKSKSCPAFERLGLNHGVIMMRIILYAEPVIYCAVLAISTTARGC